MKSINKLTTFLALSIMAYGAGFYGYKAVAIPDFDEHVTAPSVPDTDTITPRKNEIAYVTAHPLVQGGVHSLRDFRTLIQKNSKLRAFYTSNGFDLSCFSERQLPTAIEATVSFREGKEIHWSHKTVTIPKGETVIEDCKGHIIREQCGNLIYFQSTTPDLTLPTGPSVIPAAGTNGAGDADIQNVPPVYEVCCSVDFNAPGPLTTIPNTITPSSYYPSVPVGGTPVSTPEPNLIFMAVMGIIILAVVKLRNTDEP